MTSLAWKLNRLRAMGAREVAHRAIRFGAQSMQRGLVAGGWRPAPRRPVGPGAALFPETGGWREAWHERYRLDHAALAKLVANELDLFSYRSLDVGRPVNWHRNPVTGQLAPRSFGKAIDYRDDRLVGDIKVLWELGRHQHLVPLAVAYAVSGDSTYKQSVLDQIEGWIATNPFGIGIHWCSSLEVSLRLISWAVVHGLFVLGGHADGLFSATRDSTSLGRAIYEHAWFIRHYLSKYSSANNHLIGELTGLWTGTQVFDLGPDGERWGSFAHAGLEREARLQVYADGVDKEQAVYYHLWVLEYLLVSWLVGERTGRPFSSVFRKRILSMSGFLRDVSLEDGSPPQIGDADDGFTTRFEPGWPRHSYSDVQNAVSRIFGPAGATAHARRSQKAFWYGMIADAPLSAGATPAPTYRHRYPVIYPKGGYAILGDDRVRLVFDAGSLGYPSIAAHGHADALSFCLGIDGMWWLVDAGTYAYHSETEWRDFFRGTSAHNTVVIDDANQSRIGGNFLWLDQARAELAASGRREDGTQWARARHDGYRSLGAIHERELTYRSTSQLLEITDRIEAVDAPRPRRIAVLFHFHPDIEVVRRESSWTAKRPDGETELSLELDPKCGSRLVMGGRDPIQGWYSDAIGRRVPAPAIVVDHTGTPPLLLSTRIRIR